MKKILSLSIALICIVAFCNAQIKPNLKNLKEKAADKTNIGSDKSGKKEEVKDKATGVPEYDPESPTYRAYSICRDEISSTRNLLKPENWDKNIEGRNDDAVRYLAKAKENLAKLQADVIESKKPYVKDLEKNLNEVDAERKAKFDSYTADQEWDKKIEAYYKFAIMGWEIQDKTLEPSYTGYFNMRKEFEAARPEKFKSDYVQKRVTDVDNFFKVEVYKVVPELDKEVDKIITNIHSKNSSGDEEYLLNAKSYLKDFEDPIKSITYNKKYLLEDKSGIDAVQAKIDKEKAMLDEYISSGKYDAHVAKFRQALIDAVKLSPKKMTNAKYEQMATAGVDKGKVTRVVITSDVWFVKKTDWGFPEYKYLPVDIAVSFEGKCYLAYGQIRKTYEGGGVYGGEFFNYWGMQEEMNCANVNK
ncbi:MAG: hypothetical protein CVU05_09870 [Bacteroidetes bacterium HGW-Bacteroidetes-21]|nr:MAG: hypothetical protein CVU05_09870 [Bacteroidetes bacterium HGW-Bacteroidetes-21]